MALEILPDIVWEHAAWRRKRAAWMDVIETTLPLAARSVKGFPRKAVAVSILLTDDASIKTINRKHRGKNKPTNVLSFPQYDTLDDFKASREPMLHLGDIIVAYETVAREAKAESKTIQDHFTHLLVHGFLHLLGYDHMNDRDAGVMESLEVRILKKIGINNPYIDGTSYAKDRKP